jgi:Mg2+ and Co2+ transporter CorA
VDQTYNIEAAEEENLDLKMLHIAYFRDVYDHIASSLAKLEDHLAACNGSETTYLGKVSITVGNSANRMAGMMKKFSSIGTIILPITYVTGVFGMNVPIPFQNGGPNGDYYDLTAFYCIAIGNLLFAIVLGFFFKKNHWL